MKRCSSSGEHEGVIFALTQTLIIDSRPPLEWLLLGPESLLMSVINRQRRLFSQTMQGGHVTGNQTPHGLTG